MAKVELTPQDREFFSRVMEAVFTNPFSDERAKVDTFLSGAMPGAEERRQDFMPRVVERLARLEAEGIRRFQDLCDADAPLVQYSWLFCIYHQYIDRLDALIREQARLGDTPAPAPFGMDVLTDLQRRGFARDEALRFLELFYQLRRAFYFIEQDITGLCPSMVKLRLALWNNVFTHNIALYDRHLWRRMEDFSTLILGETGVGKGTAAAAIGRSGYIPFNTGKRIFEESFTRTFLAINLSQYPESLLESELFGHRKGAFTGAMEHHEGIFARASAYGALFLDEIGEVSVPVQIKLLQVLQERTFLPVGSHEKRRFEGRVIAATNSPLDKLRARGAFREDFFYRLCTDVITVPSLRQRLAEDPHELDHLLRRVVERILGMPSAEVVAMVRRTLDHAVPHDYPWPGNVRELEQAVRRILLTGSYAPEAVAAGPMQELFDAVEAGSMTASELLGAYCAHLYRRFGSYEEVARRTGLDRRTARKHILAASPHHGA